MRILIVEDEYKIATALKKGLEQEAFAVDVVHDGEDGLTYALDEPYDVIVLDRMLPNMDGLTICRKIREAKVSTPILFLTAKDQVSDRVTGLEAGADDYLVKPFSFNELLARVRSLLRRPQQISSDELQAGDLTLNPATFEVKRGKTQIYLTQKEFALLEYLLRHKGRILTKDMIISHVWDYDADILPNSVEVYMRYLRNKIEKPFPKKTKLLRTIRGFGYKIG